MSPRSCLLLLIGFGSVGCSNQSSSDDPPVSDPLRILAMGGFVQTQAFSSAGGSGGDITVRASEAVQFASAETGPSTPSLPAAPTTGTELTDAMIATGSPIAGNILISSTLRIAAGVNPATITTNDGDIVISGSLLGERSAAAKTNGISISAPAGTIYVLGEIRTPGTAGTPQNPDGGDITLTAMRIVIAGSIDARGLADLKGSGGNGGAVTIDTTGGGTEVLYTAGSIVAMGGDGRDQGGTGGDITLRAGTRLSVFAPVVTHGGSATATGVTATGGNGGDVVLRGDTGADLSASISSSGGDGTGHSQGAAGGDGGDFAADGAGPWRVLGTINTSGGTATAPTGGSGGTAGSVTFGLNTPVTTLELGRGSYSTSGAAGNSAGGDAGSIDVASLDGNISVGGRLIARGGDSQSAAGNGGAVTITTDADVLGNSSNHSLTASTSVDTRGRDGGAVLLQCGGNLAFTGEIVASGMSNSGDAGRVSLVVASANLAPDGTLTVQGTIRAEGAVVLGDSNGHGGAILFASAGDLSIMGAVTSRGGGNSGGTAGPVTIQSTGGGIRISGSILTSTGPPYLIIERPTPGDVTVLAAGDIVGDAVIDASGGMPHPEQTDSRGADGGTVSFTSTGGSITLLAGTDIKANGGKTNAGVQNNQGGAGGRILFSTRNQAVSITGILTAKGGPAPTAPSTPGGLGGQVVVNTDSDADGMGGAITLTAGSVIDVSGASGFDAGDALNNGGVAPADSSGANLAVIFDAAGGLTSSPDTAGVGMVQNLGTITATGGSIVARGGDIWFDGRNGAGADIGPGDGGSLIQDGNGGAGAFFPN
jgi:hypothetical protein